VYNNCKQDATTECPRAKQHPKLSVGRGITINQYTANHRYIGEVSRKLRETIWSKSDNSKQVAKARKKTGQE
jgi:hypothetical protein